MRPSGEPLPDPPTTLWEVVTRHAATSPDAVALHFEGHETRYAALRAQAEALAGRLERWGACPESRIGYLGKNTDQYFVLLFAVARIGAVLVPMNWRLAPEEIAFIVADSEMQLLLADDAFLAVARDLAYTFGHRAMLATVIACDLVSLFKQHPHNAFADIAGSPNDDNLHDALFRRRK